MQTAARSSRACKKVLVASGIRMDLAQREPGLYRASWPSITWAGC